MLGHLLASAYRTAILSHSHFSGPVRQKNSDLHPKHVVQCVGGDAVRELRISSSLCL